MREPFFEEVEALPGQLEWEPEPRGGLEATEFVFAGMGGSALAAEAAGAWLGPERFRRVSREAGLPEISGPDLGVVCVSFSGNTRETLTAWEEAGRRGWPRAAVASGGRLLDAARQAGAPWARVPAGLAPRSSLGYLLKACLSLCASERRPDWREAAAHLGRVAETCRPAAAPIGPSPGGWAVVHGPGTALAAKRWEADFSENAKLPLWPWPFPEAAHNNLMVLARESRHPRLGFYALETARDARDPDWRAFVDTLVESGARVDTVSHPHADPWIELLGLAYAGDWRSVQHAEALGVSASSLSLLEAFKARRQDQEP